MRLRFSLALPLVIAALVLDAEPDAVISNITELLNLSNEEVSRSRNFTLSGTLIGRKGSDYFISDGTSAVPILVSSYFNPSVGDVITVEAGKTRLESSGVRRFEVSKMRKTGRATVPPPVATTIERLCGGGLDFMNVRIRGIVQEFFQDEVDASYTYVVLAPCDNRDGKTLLCSINQQPFSAKAGATVELTGTYFPWIASSRRYMGPILFVPEDRPSTILKTPADSIDALPEIPDMAAPSPAAIRALGRRQLCGVVLATWHDRQMLIRSDDGRMHRIELSSGQAMPACGDVIRAGGAAETDLYLINLSHAICDVIGREDNAGEKAAAITPETILYNKRGRRQIDTSYYGKTIRICGTVTNPQSVLHDRMHLYLDCGQHIVPVDISSVGPEYAETPLDSKIEATGICILNIGNWVSGAPTPRIDGFSVVARTPSDIVVLASPPWWTPGKFLIVICALLAVLVGGIVWIRILNRLVERRSRELLRAQISRTAAELKVSERTRLAVELHDSLSQNLSGVACQLVAMKCALQVAPDTLAKKLRTADQMLQSCRTELRRCLFDLRGTALECNDMNTAICDTIAPIAESVDIRTRCNIPRSRLMDSTAHAILCIIRELVSNAVTHGKATKIRIAGDIRDGRLAFSVRDNGTGFDPADCPGPADGHFGLEGIRDRVCRLDGRFSLQRIASGGMRAEITVNIPQNAREVL